MAAVKGVSKSVQSVEFGFLTDEEVKKLSVVKINNNNLVDLMGRPVPGGLYDPSLGPYQDETCKTCSQGSHHCPGHCGHIELLMPVYNPLLFNFLHKLLQRICFTCHRLRIKGSLVKMAVKKLELISKGDIAGAKRLDESLSSEVAPDLDVDSDDEDMSHEYGSSTGHPLEQQQQWTSLQFTEAMKVLNTLQRPLVKKCANCGAASPRITSPNFGLFYINGMSSADISANVTRQLGEVSRGEIETIDEENATQTPRGKGNSKNTEKEPNAAREYSEQKNMFSKKLLPSEVKNHIELFWEKEVQFCSYLSDIQQRGKKAGYSMFFLQAVLVLPIKFRPQAKGGESVRDHPQTVLLNKVLQSNIELLAAYGKKEQSKITDKWWELQQSINVFFDSKTAKSGSGQKDVATGICQILEKKEGMFRQKMMGKRVNYACRSVISPDPYLDVNEIGIPPCFAVKLTYPERVTPWNTAQLRNAVINGSENHPGAIQYVDKSSFNRLPPVRKARISIARKLSSSTRAAVMQPGKSSDYEYDGKIVYRHLRDGDIVLVNRQPTLHKISMMAHKVRVLAGEKTLRMHYANCSTYNADFDGDEMNVHFPQDEVSRAEGYNIVNANNQYVKPSNGEPIRGLIQDHVVSASILTNMDSFLTGDQFVQLLHSSSVFGTGRISVGSKPGKKVLFSCSEDEIQIPPPAVSKPVDLWTGKQVITALLNHITKGHPSFTVEKGAKIPHDFFKNRANGTYPKNRKEKESVKVNRRKKLSCEDKMLIKGNYLVQGVIDKAQFGEHGLVHTVHELYGSDTAGLLLSALSRLFTAFLQMHGFTCGVDDLLIMKAKDEERKKQLESCEKLGELVHRNFIGIKDENIKIDPLALQLNIEKTIRSEGESALAYLDRQMTNELNSKTSTGVVNELLSVGLLKPSGKNCISLMTTSGAKGSKVNFQQISSFLGQQELEGKRVPRMVSGKTLPCFHPWDWDARAGGFIIDRFLTGLRPQEYYFHCMAGREGLVDTAVKTSRSGYLQRCLIKNLECLKISYDHTVRDADGSIVQFCYGEDGVDVHQTSFITKFEVLTENKEIICQKYEHLEAFNSYIVAPTDALKEKAKKFISSSKKYEKNEELSQELNKLVKQKYFSSLAQPGEPVGVLAAQSVGEPSTQMTLNTFHLAGRGEMNVTLGIPRLQEILMTASSNIQTPIMTCPFQRGRTEYAAYS
ncbi:hypothetical protein Tsubulata_031298 [Turnera subulata]|uniref:DNA-directed RNA polymerase subunit n=1 Tax=Turnera subulata TaxID=218843 RepID=A0A9Q0JKF2_9ROSI|nr:hypothetical protein Tsubulata_031298 [Turnera subulata]